jgi:tight adherence protein C
MLGVPWHVIGGAALVVASLPILGWALSGSRRPSSGEAAAAVAGYDGRRVELKVSATDRLVVPLLRGLGRGVRRITPTGWVDSLDRRIRLAGSPATWTLERTLAMKVTLGLLGALAAYTSARGALTTKIAFTAAGWFLGYLAPDVILYGRGADRQQQILRELPDTLDQLTISVEAGLGFDAALQRVAASGTGPLAEELTRVLSEIKVGVPRGESLKKLLSRTNVHELRHFILALQQAEQFGLPVARVLRIQSGELRMKRRQRAEEAAMKIPVKIVFPLVVCIFPALFVVLLGPAMIRVARVLL